MVRDIIAGDRLPDYVLEEEEGDIIAVRPRDVIERPLGMPQLKEETFDKARRLSPGADVYALQADWYSFWIASGRPSLRSADGAFLGWVKKSAAGGLS